MTQSHRSDSAIPFLILAVETASGRRLCLNCASLEDRQTGVPVLAGNADIEVTKCDACGGAWRHARSFGEWHEDNWGYRWERMTDAEYDERDGHA